jgi:hypothetical protein
MIAINFYVRLAKMINSYCAWMYSYMKAGTEISGENNYLTRVSVFFTFTYVDAGDLDVSLYRAVSSSHSLYPLCLLRI